jgi:hypothetical protein
MQADEETALSEEPYFPLLQAAHWVMLSWPAYVPFLQSLHAEPPASF